MKSLRMNTAVASLMRSHGLDVVSATKVCCELERVDTQMKRFGVVLRGTSIAPPTITKWLNEHGYGVEPPTSRGQALAR